MEQTEIGRFLGGGGNFILYILGKGFLKGGGSIPKAGGKQRYPPTPATPGTSLKYIPSDFMILLNLYREHPVAGGDHAHLLRAKSLDTGLKLSSSPPQARSNGHRRPGLEASDLHICVLCLKALMNNSVS